MGARNRPIAWKAHLENYAELYENARNTPVPTKLTMGGKQTRLAKDITKAIRNGRANRKRS